MKKYDVIILGGGVSGGLMALALIKRNPILKITIIEKSTSFHKKVGESTSDITALYFKSEGLQHILDRQLPKTGLRFWFDENLTGELSRNQEYSSPSYKSLINGYQFNRSQIDQDLLDECLSFGIDIYRPAIVEKIEFAPFRNQVIVEYDGENLAMECNWLIDCSGRNRLVSKKLNWGKDYTGHNTSSTWAHFTDLKPMKTWDIRPSKILDRDTIQPRTNVTGHFMRNGLWWWHIPLNDGTTSLGVVFDKNIYPLKNPREQFNSLIENDPRLKELIKDSKMSRLYHYPHLPYLPNKLFNNGTLVIGDAAGFIDPLFSPGIEMTCQQISWLTPLLTEYFRAKKFDKNAFDKYERYFLNSFKDRMFVYEDKYKSFGSYDVFSCWTQMDFIGYYLFYTIPSSFFPSFLKRPIVLWWPLKSFYVFFKNRYLSIAHTREKEGRKSNMSGDEIRYSGAAVPMSPKILFVTLRLISNWLKLYLCLEWGEIKEKFSPKTPLKKSQD